MLDASGVVGAAVEEALIAVVEISALGGWLGRERILDAGRSLVARVKIFVRPADGVLGAEFLVDPDVV